MLRFCIEPGCGGECLRVNLLQEEEESWTLSSGLQRTGQGRENSVENTAGVFRG